MIAKDRGRKLRRIGFGLVVLAIAATRQAQAQQGDDSQYRIPPPAPRGSSASPDRPPADGPKNLSQIKVPPLQQTRVPVSPSDPIAVVNNQVITRQQLADECVAREGKKILDAMINRSLIEQALARGKMSITAAEIDKEIETVAGRFGIGRESWLRTLDKERGISPSQYARDIIYPASPCGSCAPTGYR